MIVDGILVKTIPRFLDYAIAKDGRVWSKPRTTPHGHKRKGRWLNLKKRSGYLAVNLSINFREYSYSVHRLILETYVGLCPKGMECRHLDGNSLNNNLDNLCWGTHSENIFDSIKHGTHINIYGEQCSWTKLTEQDVRMIIYMYRTGLFLQREIAKIYGVTQRAISKTVNRKTWKHLWVVA